MKINNCYKPSESPKIKWVILLLGAFIICLSSVRAETRYESYPSGEDASTSFGAATWKAQTFTVGTSGLVFNFKVTNVSVKGYRTSGGTDAVILGIRTIDTNGKPTGADLVNGTVGKGAFPLGASQTDALWVNITMNSTNYTLYAGATYALVLRSPTGADIEWDVDSSSASYAGGSYLSSSDSGATWTATATTDTLFQVWGENASIPINFTLCDNIFSVPFINFTFKDEVSLSTINATITTSSFVYNISDGIGRSYLFSNITANPSYAFCLSPPNESLTLAPNMQYAATGYPQRTYNPSRIALSNTTTNKILYLLGAGDGSYVTFQIINAADQPLTNVSVNLTRSISGTDTLIGAGYSGSDGGITFWQNPDAVHTACFSLSPYPQYCVTQAFTQSEYTITLGSTTGANISDYNKGITYSLKPTASYLENSTYYLFNFTLSSSYWDLDSFGFNITNGTTTIIGTNSSLLNSGSVFLNLTTGLNKTIYLTYYWVINGTITSATRVWPVIDLSGNTYSIAHLISDFTSYVALGLFGLSDFGVGIIAFVIILGITGTLRVKYGIADETVLIGLVFSLVAFFDISLGLIPNPVGAVDNFPTVLMGIIFSGFLFKEVFQ